MSDEDLVWDYVPTPVEQGIGMLLRLGLSNQEIAQRLGYSDKHVRNRLVAMFEKTGARNRTQLAVMLERMEWAGSA